MACRQWIRKGHSGCRKRGDDFPSAHGAVVQRRRHVSFDAALPYNPPIGALPTDPCRGGPVWEADTAVMQDEARTCPDCGSDRTVLVHRSLAAVANEMDQYFRCEACGRVTYEIVARTAREVKAGRIEPGRSIREAGKVYTVRRVLKVGLNEYLVYLRPGQAAPGPAARR